MQTITNIKQYTNEKWFNEIGYKTKDNQTYLWCRCDVCNCNQAHLVEFEDDQYFSVTGNCIYCKNEISKYMRELTESELDNIEARCQLVKRYGD